MSGRNSTTIISNNTLRSSIDRNQTGAGRAGRTQVSEQVGCRHDTLTIWIDKYLEDELSALVELIRHLKPNQLSPEQQQQLKAMTEMTPNDRPTMDTIAIYGWVRFYRK